MILLSAALAACGGGGSSSSASNPPPAPPPPPAPLSIDDTNAETISHAVFSSAELALTVADEASFALQALDGTALYASSSRCGNGTVDYSLIDADQNGKLSAGDTVNASYTGCQSNTSDGVWSGELSLTVVAVDDNRGSDDVHYVARVDGSGLTNVIDNAFIRSLTGSYEFEYVRGVYESSISVRGDPAFLSTDRQVPSASWTGLDVAKSEYYETATSEIQITGAVSSDSFDGTATVTTAMPLSGYLDTFPDSGRIDVSGEDQSRLYVGPSPTMPDSYAIAVDSDGGGNFNEVVVGKSWDMLTGRYLWWYELSEAGIYAIHSNADDYFEVMSRRPFYVANFGTEYCPVNPQIRIQLSRPVDPSTVPANIQMELLAEEWPSTPLIVDLDTEVRGALLIFRPTTQLAPGGKYAFPVDPVMVYDYAGDRADFTQFDGEIRVQEPVKSVAKPKEALAFPGDTVDLDGLASTSESGVPASYHWAQVLGSAASIANADSPTATLTVPAVAAPELARVNLQTENEFGEVDIDNTDINVFPDPASVDVVVMRGMKSDGSIQETLYTPVNGTQTYLFNGQDYLSVANDTDYEVTDSQGGIDQFRLDLAVVFTAPSTQVLGVGEYTVPGGGSLSSPGLRVVGEEGCFGGPGTFNVREFETGPMNAVEKLAVDYEFSCGPGYGFTKVAGHVRYRSTVAIPSAFP